jgi:pimeloyl-ACP methyl ester carboxylesterase
MPQPPQRITLPDDRTLTFDEHGPPEGKPILYFHGSPSSRLEWSLFGSQAMAQALGIRIIAPDRPGMGGSTFQPNRHILDWPRDVVALADHLQLDTFAVMGYSGGGPYAAVCALIIPERLTKVGVISGTAPFDRPGLADVIHPDSRRFMDLSRERPWLSRLSLRMMGLLARFVREKMIANAMAALPEPDRQIIAQPEFQQGFLRMFLEALRQGPRGAQHETQLMVSPWGFRPQEIKMRVQLWHGEADRNAPPAMGRYMAEAIPNSKLQLYPSEGHLSLFAKYSEIFHHFVATEG